MCLRRFLLFTSCILLSSSIYAQWSKEDSLWMEDVKAGKIKIQLDPEVQKAIEEGRFIRTERADKELLESPSQYSITKEFTGIRPEKEENEPIDFSSLPPAIFFLYDVPDSTDKKSVVLLKKPKDYISMKQIPIGTSGVYITATTGELNPIVKDGQSRGGALLGVGYGFSMEDILRHLLMPSERAKKRNRKNARTWKNY